MNDSSLDDGEKSIYELFLKKAACNIYITRLQEKPYQLSGSVHQHRLKILLGEYKSKHSRTHFTGAVIILRFHVSFEFLHFLYQNHPIDSTLVLSLLFTRQGDVVQVVSVSKGQAGSCWVQLTMSVVLVFEVTFF
jgi:hypothetical protein